MKKKLPSKIKVFAAAVAIGLVAAPFVNTDFVPNVTKLMRDAARVQQMIDSGSVTTPAAIQKLMILKNTIIGIISSARRPSSCDELRELVPSLRSGYYSLYPKPLDKSIPSVHAWCEVNASSTWARTVWSQGSGNIPSLNTEISSQTTLDINALDTEIGKEITAPHIISESDAKWATHLTTLLSRKYASTYISGNKALIAYHGGSLTLESDVNNVNGRKIFGLPAVVRSADKVTVFSSQFLTAPPDSTQRSFIEASSKTCIKHDTDGGANIYILTGCSSGSNQKYTLVRQGGSSFQIKNVSTGTCFAPEEDNQGRVLVRSRPCSKEANTSASVIRQTWQITTGNVSAIKSRQYGTCLVPEVSGDRTLLVLKPCVPASYVWIDSAADHGIFEKSASRTNPKWTSWRRVSTNNIAALNAPAATITSSGKIYFASSDGTTISVYTQVANGQYPEFIRTKLPFPYIRLVPLGLIAGLDMGDAQPTLIMSAFRAKPYFARFSGGYITKWSESENYVRPTGLSIGLDAQMQMVSLGANLLRTFIPIQGTYTKSYRTDMSIKNDPGICTLKAYAKNYPALEDLSIEKLTTHYNNIGKAAGRCEPYLEKCSVKEYLSRYPAVSASNAYRLQPIRHWTDHGSKFGFCKPFIPTCTVQDFKKVRKIGLRREGYLSALLEYHQWIRNSGTTAKTCYPIHSKKCAPSQYLARRPDVAAQAKYVDNPGLHYAMYGMAEGMCEPSLPEKCLEPFTTAAHVKLCMSISAEPRLLTGDFLLRNSGSLPYLKSTCSQKLNMGLPLSKCLYDPDSWYVLGFPIDGPQVFTNKVGYRWLYTGTDGSGCGSSCRPFSATLPCNAVTQGVRMAFHEPGTHNNDYVYQCVADTGH